jgi:hypothetical protein
VCRKVCEQFGIFYCRLFSSVVMVINLINMYIMMNVLDPQSAIIVSCGLCYNFFYQDAVKIIILFTLVQSLALMCVLDQKN